MSNEFICKTCQRNIIGLVLFHGLFKAKIYSCYIDNKDKFSFPSMKALLVHRNNMAIQVNMLKIVFTNLLIHSKLYEEI